MHSRKKRIEPPTPEELAAEKLRLEKLQKLHKAIFDEILSSRFTDEGFSLSEKAMATSPDIYTFLNFRRNLILNKIAEASPEEKIKTFATELEILSRMIKDSPKSYTLWFHRQWVLRQCANITEIMQKELALCDYMLKKDNRNFHVWNYRSWVVALEGNQGPNEEMEFTKTMICRDFSNFSAWHYRTKILKKMYGPSIPEDFIRSELSMLKNAYFTCPNDQSVWNYHRWLLLGLESIKIVGIDPVRYENPPSSLTVGFSHNICGLNTEVVGVSGGWDPVDGKWEPVGSAPYSYIWKFTPTTAVNGALEIRLNPLHSGLDCNGLGKFTQLVYKFKENNGVFEFSVDGVEDNEIFEQELKNINELLDIEEDDVVQVLLRKSQMLEVLAYSGANSAFIDQIVNCYQVLVKKDPRHAVFYEEYLDALRNLKLNRRPENKIVSLKLQAKLLGLN